MRILGIDPGLTRCGLGVVDVDSMRKLTLVEVSVARSGAGEDIAKRVHDVSVVAAEWMARYRPDVVAMERVFSQQNLGTVMGVAHVSGAVMFHAIERGIDVVLYTPTQVKSAISGYGGADKGQVQSMVQRVLGLDAPPRPADAADALAIAICHAWRSPNADRVRDAAPAARALTPAQQMWEAAERRAGR